MQACWLVKNGVPFGVAFGDHQLLTKAERSAMAIVFSETEGNQFNFDTMSFVERK